MRISDWSSDVCSSDLLGFVVRYPGGKLLFIQSHQRPIEQQRFMSRRFQQRSRTAEFQRQMRLPAAEIYAAFKAPVGIYERYSHAGILILLPALALPSQPIHAAKIGRASCRERVCQYV